MIPDTHIPPEVQEYLPIGPIANAITKDCIMRAYINGVLTMDEAQDWISEMGLQGA